MKTNWRFLRDRYPPRGAYAKRSDLLYIALADGNVLYGSAEFPDLGPHSPTGILNWIVMGRIHAPYRYVTQDNPVMAWAPMLPLPQDSWDSVMERLEEVEFTARWAKLIKDCYFNILQNSSFQKKELL